MKIILTKNENIVVDSEKKNIPVILAGKHSCFVGDVDVDSICVRFVWKKTCGD